MPIYRCHTGIWIRLLFLLTKFLSKPKFDYFWQSWIKWLGPVLLLALLQILLSFYGKTNTQIPYHFYGEKGVGILVARVSDIKYRETVWSNLYRGNYHTADCLQPRCWQLKMLLS